MTAAVLYGREDMKIERVDIPSVAEDEVLVRVEVALTCGTDLKVWKQGSHPRMIEPPALFGIPFFYWFQLLMIPLSALAIFAADRIGKI